ncbi:MAG: ATP-binding protein [Acidobacteriota bacterium]
MRYQTPVYRKLLLENKILLFTALLLLCSVGVVLAAQWFVAGDAATLRRVAVLSVLPVFLLVLASRAVIRRAVEPLKALTRVADDISTGNLDPALDFGVHVNCWDIKGCQRADCKAYMNFSEQCWFIDGTPCDGYEPRFPQKLEGCRSCEVYQTHRGDEIVQLADSFRHMTNVLKASREELTKSDDFQKRLIRNSFDGIVATERDGITTIFNRVAEELTGYSREAVVGRLSWTEFFEAGLEHQMDKPLSYERVRRVRGFRPRESALRRSDGTWIDVRLAGISLYERGLHIGRVFFFQDLREIKSLREELIRSERLAATGQAAAGISHSIRNILDGLRGGLYVYKQGQRLADDAKMRTGWGMIERNVDVISDLVRDLLNFAKHREPDLVTCDPRDLISDVVSTVAPAVAPATVVRVEVPDDAGPVLLDPLGIHQCLSNLLRNAIEAIPPDRAGHVTVAFCKEDDTSIFSVADDGMGMSAETLERVRGGMYSTKGSKGTGLGLLVVQKIVNEHQGVLTIDSREGRGSTFRIEIPSRIAS